MFQPNNVHTHVLCGSQGHAETSAAAFRVVGPVGQVDA
jgi:hypothetical protein